MSEASKEEISEEDHAGRQDYKAVNIPQNLVKQVDKLVGKHGYASRAEVVRAAVRMLLRYYIAQTSTQQATPEEDEDE